MYGTLVSLVVEDFRMNLKPIQTLNSELIHVLGVICLE